MLRVSLGDVLAWDGAEYVVAAASATATLLCRLGDGTRIWVDLPTMVAAGEIHLADAPAGNGPDRVLPVGEGLVPARWWEAHLNEVIHGVPDPADTGAVPRPGYEVTSKTARRALKAQQLSAAGIAVTVRTLARKERDYRERGLPGLIDRRTTAGSAPAPTVDERVTAVVVDVLAAMTGASTVSTTTLINRVHARLAERRDAEEIAVPSDRTLRRLVDAYDRRRIARGSATTRRQVANRPNRGPRPVTASYPGEVTEIDSTPVNVACVMPDGSIGRASLTCLLDIATHSLLGFSMVPTGASGVEHADLLARVLRPRRCRPDAPGWMRLNASPVLPAAAMIAADPRQDGALAVPYIFPETITTDRGRDYLSETFIAACRHFGISVTQAPPRSPTFKTHIERFLGAADSLWMQKQPGYLGTDPTRRGDVGLDGLPTLRELADSFEEWWIRVWQNRPNDALRDRDIPARRFSPNQMFAVLFDASAGIPVPIDQGTYISLMPVHRRVLQPGAGFRIDHLTYWSDRLQPLVHATPPNRDGRWDVHVDPYEPGRAWVADPDTGEWIEAVSTSWRRDVVPFASALRRLRSLPAADAGVQDAWAEQTLTGAPAGLSGKRAARRAAVLAQRDADAEPRPGPILDPPPPPRDVVARLADEFRVVGPDEDLWNAP